MAIIDQFRLRDNGQHYLVKLLLPPRRIFAELGARLTASGWLASPDDVFFLAYQEIAAACSRPSPAETSASSTEP